MLRQSPALNARAAIFKNADLQNADLELQKFSKF